MTKMVAADPAKPAPHTIHAASGRVYQVGANGAFDIEPADVAEMTRHGLATAATAEIAALTGRVAALESRLAKLEAAGAKAK